jgi:hypothetical protein
MPRRSSIASRRFGAPKARFFSGRNCRLVAVLGDGTFGASARWCKFELSKRHFLIVLPIVASVRLDGGARDGAFGADAFRFGPRRRATSTRVRRETIGPKRTR